MTPIANHDGRITLLAAMALQEGWGPSGTRPTRNNSPLDLIAGDEAIRFGSIGADGRYARFATDWDGFDAGRRWLSIPAKFAPTPNRAGDPEGPRGYLVAGYLGATLRQVVYRFAPKGDGGNDPVAYLSTIVTHVTYPERVTGDTILTPDLLVIPNSL